MKSLGKDFNLCKKCGGKLKVVITRRYSTCRIRVYECPCCHHRRKSVESFREDQ